MAAPIGFVLLTYREPRQILRLVSRLRDLYGLDAPIVVNHDFDRAGPLVRGTAHPRGNVPSDRGPQRAGPRGRFGRLRHVGWSSHAPSPRELDASDLPRMLASGAHFARKFPADAPVLAELDRALGLEPWAPVLT
jgi:hypothetical protein